MRYDKLMNCLINKHATERMSKERLCQYYQDIYENDNSRTFDNVIALLKKNDIITEVENDQYVVVTKGFYRYPRVVAHNVRRYEDAIYDVLHKVRPKWNFIVWDTSAIRKFSSHSILDGNCIIVECEKARLDEMVNLLEENFSESNMIITQKAFLEDRRYYETKSNIIIVKPLHIKSPLYVEKGRKYLTVEKLMIDFYVDAVYEPYHQDLKRIYKIIFQNYDVCLKKVIKYGEFRTNIQEYKEFLHKLKIPKKYQG